MPRGPANVINDDVFTKSVIEQAKDVLGDFGDLTHKRLLLHACSNDEYADRVESGQGTKASTLDLPVRVPRWLPWFRGSNPHIFASLLFHAFSSV